MKKNCDSSSVRGSPQRRGSPKGCSPRIESSVGKSPQRSCPARGCPPRIENDTRKTPQRSRPSTGCSPPRVRQKANPSFEDLSQRLSQLNGQVDCLKQKMEVYEKSMDVLLAKLKDLRQTCKQWSKTKMDIPDSVAQRGGKTC